MGRRFTSRCRNETAHSGEERFFQRGVEAWRGTHPAAVSYPIKTWNVSSSLKLRPRGSLPVWYLVQKHPVQPHARHRRRKILKHDWLDHITVRAKLVAGLHIWLFTGTRHDHDGDVARTR